MSTVIVKKIEAHREPGINLDPNGFFVIMVDHSKKKIVVEHYENVSKGNIKVATGRLTHIITGDSAKKICDTLEREKLVTQLDHVFYMGRELQKAEIALRKGLEYVQDEECP